MNLVAIITLALSVLSLVGFDNKSNSLTVPQAKAKLSNQFALKVNQLSPEMPVVDEVPTLPNGYFGDDNSEEPEVPVMAGNPLTDNYDYDDTVQTSSTSSSRAGLFNRIKQRPKLIRRGFRRAVGFVVRRGPRGLRGC